MITTPQMKALFKSLKKHPGSIIFYLINVFLWYQTLHVNKVHSLDGGLVGVFGFFTAIIFIIISLIKAIRTKDQYYLWLILFIVVPLVILVIFNY